MVRPVLHGASLLRGRRPGLLRNAVPGRYASYGQARARPVPFFRSARGCARMQEGTAKPIVLDQGVDGLTAAAERAAAWAGEPFLHVGEEPAAVLAPGTLRRRALDAAAAEMDADMASPSSDWRIAFSLMLGLERVLSRGLASPRLGDRASPPSDRRARRHAHGADRGHQRDQAESMENGLASEALESDEEDEDDEEGDDGGEGELEDESEEASLRRPGRRAAIPVPSPDRVRQDHRRGGLRRGGAHDGRPHPHPSPAARRPVQPRPHGRGIRRTLHARRSPMSERNPPRNPITIQTYAWFARHVGIAHPHRVPARHLRRGTHRARREDERRDPQLPRARSTSG